MAAQVRVKIVLDDWDLISMNFKLLKDQVTKVADSGCALCSSMTDQLGHFNASSTMRLLSARLGEQEVGDDD